jgi:phosphatidylinositol 4-phosphatase
MVQTVFDDNRSIYSIKSVRAIPLIKDRAQHVLDTVAVRMLSSRSSGDTQDLTSEMDESTSNARVKFADENDVRIMSPALDTVGDTNVESCLGSSLPSSGTSTPTSSDSSASLNAVKVIANRMSFWSRRRQPTSGSIHDSATGSDERQESLNLDSIVQSAQGEPAAVIDTIITSTAPPPESVEERHTELEDRVVRECIREYVKGCMYFAYHFGR